MGVIVEIPHVNRVIVDKTRELRISSGHITIP